MICPRNLGNGRRYINRFRRWIHEGIWDRIYERLLQRARDDERINQELWCVDGSVIRAHRCASGMVEQSDEHDEMVALGRSRGGYSTKLHVLVDADGNVLSLTATPGQNHESTEFDCLLANCRLNLFRLANRPTKIVGDKGYSSTTIRESIKQYKIEPVIPTRSNELRRTSLISHSYRRRNVVERVIGWLKESRRVATRYDKLPCSYLTFVQLAAMRRLLKKPITRQCLAFAVNSSDSCPG